MQIPEHTFYNCVVTLSNGATHQIDATWIHNAELDLWNGWSCFAGVDRIYIDPTGAVYGGECTNDLLGHIDTGWDLLSAPTVCKRNQCNGCTDDLITEKEINNVVFSGSC